MQQFARFAVLCIAVAIAWCSAAPPIELAALPAPGGQQELPPRRVAPGQDYRGLAIQLHGGTDVYQKFHRLLPEIASLGANSVLFVVHGWQDHAGTLDLHIDPRKTAEPKALGRLCDDATRLGLRVILMPVVLLENPRNNEWRGKIVPPGHDWDAWFKRYTGFVVHFAKIAEKHKVALLMVGSELIKTEAYTDRWRGVIEAVRQEYRGKLGYSANWDHYQPSKIAFWPQLDFVGMTTYYELAKGPNPPIGEIDSNWSRIKGEILAFQKQVNRPIIFTEVGWCSQEGAAHEGWNYYANQKASEAGLREQALLYESFIKTWAAESAIGGIIWWEWDDTAGGKDDFNYTPRGKPAEQILRRLFAGKPDERLADKARTSAKPSGS